MIAQIGVYEIPTLWPEMAQVLAPAVRRHKSGSLDLLRLKLLKGLATAFRITSGADVYAILSLGKTTDTGKPALWVDYVAGRIEGGPKQRVLTIQRTMRVFETVARNAGAAEIRTEGRKTWLAALKSTGFELTMIGGTMILRKELVDVRQ